MIREKLITIYHNYIDCLNSQTWERLIDFVDYNVVYNNEKIYLSGYIKMLENDFLTIPDLRFAIDKLCSDPPMIASRLTFDCTPIGELFGFPVNAKRIQFYENVFYEFYNGKIIRVDSIIDKTAISNQLT